MTTETRPSNDPATVPRLHLRHGHSIPHLGLGTWPLVGEECETAVRYAIRSGYRLVDTAFQYRNEDAVGRGVRTAGVAREELFVSSKFNKESHSVDGVQRAYDRSLQALGLEYLDMFMCHWPVPALDQYTEAWRGLVKLLDEGRVKAIGVSNFKPDHLEKVIAATGVVPDVNQIQLSPDLARLPPRAMHQDLGIITEAWSLLVANRDCVTTLSWCRSHDGQQRLRRRFCSAGTSSKESSRSRRPPNPHGWSRTSRCSISP